MEQARETISKFTGRSGHKTDVEETTKPAVTQETVKPHRHEESQKILDREVHQDHYHTTVQPLQHQEVRPEKHSYQTRPVQERTFHHGDESQTRAQLESEAGRFHDSSSTQATQQTQAMAPKVEGEHTHHHVHETVQPIINKETIAPEIVHTTQPIHETHHASSQFHGASVMPTKNIDELQDHPSGTTRQLQEYDGVPKPYNSKMQTDRTEADRFPDRKGVDGPGAHHTGGTGLADTHSFQDDGHLVSGSRAGAQSTRSDGVPLSEQAPLSHGQHQSGDNFTRSGNQDQRFGRIEDDRKPSLMDKLNPKVDSNGDGKAGFMK